MSVAVLSDSHQPALLPLRRPQPLLPRFTLNGSAELEQHLASLCAEVSAGIRRIIPEHALVGIVLGGGYGRGEGGVLETSHGDRPYNDLEFYVFVRGLPWLAERRFAKALHALGSELESAAGVELEFKIDSVAMLRRRGLNLFDHDLLMGHRWLLGDDRLFAHCDHHRQAAKLPLSEAARLLMNRCSGLLFARDKLIPGRFSLEAADFVCRNIAKTELALGDAALIAFGKYHWSCLERGRRFRHLLATAQLPWLPELRKRHAEGIHFKLQPYRSRLSRAALLQHLRAVNSLALKVWLWLEQRRLGCSFLSAGDYAANRVNKWPSGGACRNRLANLRVFGPRALLSPRSSRHPRDRILNALALLLWMRAQASAQLTAEVQRHLLLSGPADLVVAYRDRWRRAS
jgi:hypothetical protein